MLFVSLDGHSRVSLCPAGKVCNYGTKEPEPCLPGQACDDPGMYVENGVLKNVCDLDNIRQILFGAYETTGELCDDDEQPTNCPTQNEYFDMAADHCMLCPAGFACGAYNDGLLVRSRPYRIYFELCLLLVC